MTPTDYLWQLESERRRLYEQLTEHRTGLNWLAFVVFRRYWLRRKLIAVALRTESEAIRCYNASGWGSVYEVLR